MSPIYQSARIDYDKGWGVAGFLFPVATLLHIKACFTKVFADTNPAQEPSSLIGRVKPATAWQHLARAIILAIPLFGSLFFLVYDYYADLNYHDRLISHQTDLETLKTNLDKWIKEDQPIENREGCQGSLNKISNRKEQSILVQIALDFNRKYRVALLVPEKNQRFFVEHNYPNLPPEKQIEKLEEDAKQATSDLLKCVKGLPHLTEREQLIILDYSSQTLFNHSAEVFERQCLTNLSQFLSTLLPNGDFIPLYKDLSEIVHDVENKKTQASQTVRIVDLKQVDDSRDPRSVLKLRIQSTFDWNTERMSLDLIEFS